MKPAAAIQQTPEPAAPVSLAKAYYVLFLLTLVWAFQFANIQVVNVVLERIRTEFKASDTTMGLVAGIAVVLFGSILSMPVARLADRLYVMKEGVFSREIDDRQTIENPSSYEEEL